MVSVSNRDVFFKYTVIDGICEQSLLFHIQTRGPCISVDSGKEENRSRQAEYIEPNPLNAPSLFFNFLVHCKDCSVFLNFK